MSGFIGRKRTGPRTLYYRSHINRADIRRVMLGNGWMTSVAIAAHLSDKLPPEVGARYYELARGKPPDLSSQSPLEGIDAAIRMRLCDLKAIGKVEQHGSKNDVTYRWIEEADTPVENSA